MADPASHGFVPHLDVHCDDDSVLMRRDTRSAKACQAHLGAHLIEEWEHNPDYVMVSHGAFGAARRLHKVAMLGAPARVGPLTLVPSGTAQPVASSFLQHGAPVDPRVFAQAALLTQGSPAADFLTSRQLPPLPGKAESERQLSVEEATRLGLVDGKQGHFHDILGGSEGPSTGWVFDQADVAAPLPGGNADGIGKDLATESEALNAALYNAEKQTNAAHEKVIRAQQAGEDESKLYAAEGELEDAIIQFEKAAQDVYDFEIKYGIPSVVNALQDKIQALNAFEKSSKQFRDYLQTEEGTKGRNFIDGIDAPVQEKSSYELAWEKVQQCESEVAKVLQDTSAKTGKIQQALIELSDAQNKLQEEGKKLKESQGSGSIPKPPPGPPPQKSPSGQPPSRDEPGGPPPSLPPKPVRAAPDGPPKPEPKPTDQSRVRPLGNPPNFPLTEAPPPNSTPARPQDRHAPPVEPPRESFPQKEADTPDGSHPNVATAATAFLTAALATPFVKAVNNKLDRDHGQNLLLELYNKLSALVGSPVLEYDQQLTGNFEEDQGNQIQDIKLRLEALVGPIPPEQNSGWFFRNYREGLIDSDDESEIESDIGSGVEE